MTPWRDKYLPSNAAKPEVSSNLRLCAGTVAFAGANAACWLIANGTSSYAPLEALAWSFILPPIAIVLLLTEKLTKAKEDTFTWGAFGMVVAALVLLALLNLWLVGLFSAAV